MPKSISSTITLVCPICEGELKNEELRLHRNILYCETGAIALGAIELRIVMTLIHSPGGSSTQQLAEIVGTTIVNINSRVKQLNMKLRDIKWTMKNIAGKGRGGALYVLRRRKADDD